MTGCEQNTYRHKDYMCYGYPISMLLGSFREFVMR